MIWLLIAATVLFLGALLVAARVALKRERRRQAAAWHAYFHGGGLVRALMARWSRTPRLTDQRRP